MKKQNLKNQSMSTDITDVADVTKKNPVEITIDLRGNGATPPPTHYRYTILCSPGQVVEVRTAVVPREPLPAEITLDSEALRTALLLDLHNCPDAKVLTSIVVRLAREKRLKPINAYSAIFLKKLLPLCPLIDLTPNQFRTLQRYIKNSLNIT